MIAKISTKDSSYFIEKKNKDLYYISPRDLINCRRISRFINIKSRVFDRNMVDGFCFGNFYGINRIKYSRYFNKQEQSRYKRYY